MILKDEAGNSVIATRLANQINIEIKLRAEKWKRKVGTINLDTKTIVIHRERGKHLYLKTMSYGFNYRIIHDGRTFDKVLLKDEHGEYDIPKHVILNHGSILFHKEEGFEKQIFLPLTIIEKYKI